TFLDALPADARLAIVSSSRNAEEVLRGAGLLERFEHIVDGNVAAREGLPGKPSPDTFLHAARLLGVEPSRAVVYEDAVSGVRAGADGNFGAVIGVDRGAGARSSPPPEPPWSSPISRRSHEPPPRSVRRSGGSHPPPAGRVA